MGTSDTATLRIRAEQRAIVRALPSLPETLTEQNQTTTIGGNHTVPAAAFKE